MGRAHGPVPLLRAVLLPLAVAAAALPLLRPVFLGFLAGPEEGWDDGFAQVLFRVGLVAVGWLALDLYSAIVRGPEREVLAQWPVDAGEVVSFVVLSTAVRRWWLVPAGMIVLAPMAVAGRPGEWAIGGAVLAGTFLMTLSVGAAVLLGAIAAAEDERVAPLLDLLRGNNPRAQAAFLYAPGVVLGGVGLMLSQAAFAVAPAASGSPVAAIQIAAPLAVSAGAWLFVPGLARRRWFDGTAVLADIDARYAGLNSPEEALRVYLDWVVRFLPASVGLYVHKDLRHAWRARRTPLTGAWLGGFAGLAAAWTASPEGPGRAALVVIATTLLVAGVGAAMESDEPPFLQRMLPQDRARRTLARAIVVFTWVQPCLWPAVLGVALRQGLGPAAGVIGVGLIAAAAGAGLVAISLATRGRALLVYSPTAAVLAAALAWASGGAG
ncbi:MAG: hypothetical protein ACI8PZ_000673 [Myxococcota bacterium]|jgi:hypothetical protein